MISIGPWKEAKQVSAINDIREKKWVQEMLTGVRERERESSDWRIFDRGDDSITSWLISTF